jgi:MoaA/NifB/PqqE/SkfB family radical SAM enzyme
MMCNIWKRKVHDEMQPEEVERFFRTNRGFPWVNLSGGEIFTRKDLLDLVKSVVTTNRDLYLLDFPTTGQQTDRIVSWVEEILRLDPPKLLITCSLDGAGTQHDEIRRRKGAFERVTNTYKALRGLGAKNLDVFFGVTLSKFNKGDLFRIFDSVKEVIPWITERDFHVNLAQESAHYYQNLGMGVPKEEDALKDMEEFLRRKGFPLHPVAIIESTYQRLLHRFYRVQKSPLPCKALSSSVFIDPHWTVYPCSMWDAPLGNLREVDFDLQRLWDAEETIRRRREVLSEQCPHCWTPCEAYQTILGNLPRALVTR